MKWMSSRYEIASACGCICISDIWRVIAPGIALLQGMQGGPTSPGIQAANRVAAVRFLQSLPQGADTRGRDGPCAVHPLFLI